MVAKYQLQNVGNRGTNMFGVEEKRQIVEDMQLDQDRNKIRKQKYWFWKQRSGLNWW